MKIVLFGLLLFAVLAAVMYVLKPAQKERLSYWTFRLLIPAGAAVAVVAALLAVVLNVNIKVI